MQAELLALNLVVFSTLAVGLVVRQRRRIRLRGGVDVVYWRLNATLTKRFPDLPPGFTLREGLARARASARDIDWATFEKELSSYEAFRFGGGLQPAMPGHETLRLIKTLGGRRL